MQIDAFMQKNNLIICLIGELDESVADITRKKLDRLIVNENFNSVVFDMTKLSFMDSTGIGVLLGRYKILKRIGVKVFIKNCNKQIDKVLTLSGIYTIMEKIS